MATIRKNQIKILKVNISNKEKNLKELKKKRLNTAKERIYEFDIGE